MEDLEKYGGNFVSKEEIRVLIKPLSKPQLVDLLSQLGSRYPSIAEEIQSFVNADPGADRLPIFEGVQTDFSRACIFCRGRTFLDEIQVVPIVACVECDRRAHSSCLDSVGLEEDLSHGWYCTIRCASLKFWLHPLMKNPIEINRAVVGNDYLTWSILDVANNMQQAKVEDTIEVLGIPFSEDVARSVVEGLGPYRGFHTAIVESNGMVVSVATFRLHRDIAEVAFVTTVQSRRREGLCGLLLKELEKHLLALGVDQLILHSTPTTIRSWTTTFGYERLPLSHNFEEYNIVRFTNTITCRRYIVPH